MPIVKTRQTAAQASIAVEFCSEKGISTSPPPSPMPRSLLGMASRCCQQYVCPVLRLVQNSCESAATSKCHSPLQKNIIFSNYSQQPSPLQQSLQTATSVNQALSID